MLRILYQTPGYILCVKPRGVSSEAGEGGMPELIADVLTVIVSYLVYFRVVKQEGLNV